MQRYKNINLDRSMYSADTKSFTEVLEEMDPTKDYRNTPLDGLDSFERQLKRYDIKVSGDQSDLVGKFFSGANTATLFPEFVNRSIRAGMEESSILSEIVATVTKIDSLDYRSITSTPSDEDKKPSIIAAGAKIPETIIRSKTNLVRLNKRGRLLIAPYEIIRFQRLDLFTVTLKQIGGAIIKSQMEDAIDVLLNGDGNSNPAKSIDSINLGKLEYGDLLRLWAEFNSCEMNTLLASPSAVLSLASLEEFKNPLTGINFAGTGRMTTPLGANLIKSRQVPENMIIALDKSCALEKVEAAQVSIEYDKLIDRQLERATITTTTGFAKIFNDAVKVLKY